jgi:small subunit ribosomal protein S15
MLAFKEEGFTLRTCPRSPRAQAAVEGAATLLSCCLITFSHKNMLKRSHKKRIITKHATHKKDTGSPQVQIAILTKEIERLTDHLQEHKKDESARRGLLGKVAQRRKLLTYLKMNKPDAYQGVLESHKLKK